jgi:hypothetical protein
MNTIPSRKGKVIVSGIMFWYPLAGVTYQILHYLIGLRRLGYEVYYVEDSGRWVYDPVSDALSPNAADNVAAVAPSLEAHGFGEQWAFRGRYPDGKCYGLSGDQINQLYSEADALLNINGAQELLDEHMGRMRRIYVESDPFAFQVEIARGDATAIRTAASYHSLFSFGENLGAADCSVPVVRFNWMPTRQPIVLNLWTNPFDGGERYRTITTWSNSESEVAYDGQTYYWTKDREFVKVLQLPMRSDAEYELAAGVDDDVKDMLSSHGWHHADSVEISRGLQCYRTYIQRSRGEFTVARDQYVRPVTGWFSDRSACFLAAGRPVITQETGFSKYLPTGEALFAFRTIEDILAAVDAIETDYQGHCRAAREIACEYFAAEKVLGSLMRRAGL